MWYHSNNVGVHTIVFLQEIWKNCSWCLWFEKEKHCETQLRVINISSLCCVALGRGDRAGVWPFPGWMEDRMRRSRLECSWIGISRQRSIILPVLTRRDLLFFLNIDWLEADFPANNSLKCSWTKTTNPWMKLSQTPTSVQNEHL